MKKILKNYSYLPFGLFVLIIWQIIIVMFKVKNYIFPSPLAIMVSIDRHWYILISALWMTARETLVGFFLAIVGSLMIAVAAASSENVNKMIMPYLVIIQTTPIVAVAPLFVLWFGEGIWSRIISSFAVTLIPMTITMTRAFQIEDGGRHDIYRVFGYGSIRRFLLITFPLAIPGIISSLQFGVALAVVGAIVGELVTADAGLGYVIIQASYEVNTSLLFAAIFFAALIGIMLFLLMTYIAKVIHIDRFYISER